MPAEDKANTSETTGWDAPARRGFAVTPSDANDLTVVTRGLYVGTAGDLSVIFMEDTVAVTIVGVLAGSILPFRVRRVRATGTTATNIVGLW